MVLCTVYGFTQILQLFLQPQKKKTDTTQKEVKGCNHNLVHDLINPITQLQTNEALNWLYSDDM